jgi:hypothetical protein
MGFDSIMQRLGYLALFSGLIFLTASHAASAQSKMRVFHADMSADNETKFTESPAVGKADFTLDLDSQELKWVITYSGLKSDPVSVSIYGPAQPGANGQMMFSLAPKSMKSPVVGSSHVTEGQIQYLLYGWTYVNIVTKNFEKGEIRGQLDIKAPAQ